MSPSGQRDSIYDRILVPTDWSPGMGSAITHAIGLAEVHDAEPHGLYVVDTGSIATLPIETSWDGITEILHEEWELVIEEFRTRSGDVPTETDIIEGHPSEEIADYAAERSCDTVVMGTHGRGGIGRLLLEGVAERVVGIGSDSAGQGHGSRERTAGPRAELKRTQMVTVPSGDAHPLVAGIDH